MIRGIYKENLKAFRRNEKLYILVNLLLSPLYLFGTFANIFPIASACFISVIYNGNKGIIIPSFLILFAEFIAFGLFLLVGIYKESISLESYLEDLQSNLIDLEEVQHHLLVEDQREFIEMFFQKTNHIGKIYSFKTSSNVVNAQLKGFTFPYFPGLSEKIKENYSCVFLNINKDNNINKFYLAHEIGHMRFVNTMIYPKLMVSVFSGIFFIIMLTFGFTLSISIAFFIPLLFWLIRPFFQIISLEDKEELICDSFAVKVLSRFGEYNFKDMLVKIKKIFPLSRLLILSDSIHESRKDNSLDVPDLELAKVFGYHCTDDLVIYFLLLIGASGIADIYIIPVVIVLVIVIILFFFMSLIFDKRFKNIDRVFEKLKN